MAFDHTFLTQVLSRLSYPSRPLPAIDTAEVGKIENLVGSPLPEDYRYFLRHYNEYEVDDREEIIILWKLEDLIEYNTDIGLFEDYDNLLFIGSNGGGSYIFLDFNVEETPIVVIMDATAINQKDAIPIGSSFTDFLYRVERNIDWFE